jgi:predicted aspartyl protease
MFNLLLTLVAGILIGWNFHSFYLALDAPQIIKYDINFSQTEIEKPKKEPLLAIDRNSTKKTKKEPISFYTLLEKNLFSDAMSLYMNANEKRLITYRSALEGFFHDKSIKNPKETILQLIEYLDIEAENKTTQLQLVETYKSIKEYDKAIHLLIKFIDKSHSVIEQEKLNKEIIKTSQIYIDELNKTEKFEQLIAFLEEHIEQGLNTPFYTFTLAKHYVETNEYPLAIKFLKEIEFDEEYGEKAKTLLEKIKSKKILDKEYAYKFKLIKRNEHFLINVSINNIPLQLILDTGASYSLIDEDKITSLTLIEESITLQTPAGEITSKLQEAEIFKIEGLELENFKLVTTTFKQKPADGLLGMNFFKRFKFKIDQEKGLLYLQYNN